MILISHRGNISGPNELSENNPQYIESAIFEGFDVEVDLWCTNDLYLGHASPQYLINVSFIQKNKDKLWIHCKNYEALLFCIKKNWHCFWHEDDKYALTSKGFIWGHPRARDFNLAILVMPEKKITYSSLDKTFIGVCTDYPFDYL